MVIGGGVGFAVLLLGVSQGWPVIARLDSWLTAHIANLVDPWLLDASRTLSLILSPLVLRILTLVVAIGVFRSGLRRVALWLAGTVFAGWLVTWLVTVLVARPRPNVAAGIGVDADDYGFPSGHALTSTLLAGALLFVALRRPYGRRRHRMFWVLAITLVVLVSTSRIGLVVHHTSDVAAGWFLGLVLLGVGMLVFGITRPGNLAQLDPTPRRPYHLAVVMNPAKVYDEQRFRRRLDELARTHGWEPPLWLETTVQDPGRAMARVALESRVDLVLAAGGDGTVRAVCGELTGTHVAVGVIPVGTGNLLARNLGLPLDHEDAIEIALTGYDRAIDIVRLTGDGLRSERFTVMAGLGLDAAVVGEAPPTLKAKVGWPAYVVSMARNLSYPAVKVEVTVDGDQALSGRARMVVIGNVGRLHGGLPLLPDATPDDGKLDVVLFAPRRVTEWPGLAWRVLTRSRKADDQLLYRHGHSVVIRAAEPVPRQVDGDLLASGRELRANVEPRALYVRMPRP